MSISLRPGFCCCWIIVGKLFVLLFNVLLVASTLPHASPPPASSSSSSSTLLAKTSTTSTSLLGYDELLDWNPEYGQHVRILNTLQKLHNSSAILYFIELTNNFTANDLAICRRVSLNQLNYTVNPKSYDGFGQQADVAIIASHFLTNLFSFNKIIHDDLNSHSITSEKLYWSLLLSHLQRSQIFGAGLSFSNEFLNQMLPKFKHFTPYIFRDEHSNNKNNVTHFNLAKHRRPSSMPKRKPSSIPSDQYDDVDEEEEEEYFQSEWYWKFAFNNYEQILDEWRKMDSVDNNNNNGNNGNKMIIDHDQRKGYWSSPFLDCGITKTWLISYIVPFYGIIEDSPLLVGLVFVSINLKQIDMNQCSKHGDSFFSGTHKCHTPSTQCQNLSGFGFRSGSYICKCRQGYYYPSGGNFFGNNSAGTAQLMSSTTITSSLSSLSAADPESEPSSARIISSEVMFDGNSNQRLVNFFNGQDVEQAFIQTITGPLEKQDYFYPHNFICLPCDSGCRDCDDDSPCLIKFDTTFRLIVLIIQIICIASSIVIAILTFRLRYTKRVASSRWIMLETILLGAILLYATVIIRYYESSTITCFLEPWFREIGFAFFYGSIVIKVYRIYAEFQTRKAHRVCVQDKDLLKYLLGIVLIVFGYMSAWTALVIDGIENFRSVQLFGNSFNFTSRNILDEKYANNGLKFYVCRKLAWDYVTEIGELLFLLSGVYLTYRIRNAKKEIYKEKLTLTIAIFLETIVSFLTYVIKHTFWSHPSLHPDHLLLLYTVRCQATITTTIILLFMPKFFYKKPVRQPHHRSRYLSSAEVSEMLPESLHSAILSNGEIDIGEINLSDMDPEDIRAELRRVYTQLQVLKNKSIRKDNPHISKRRGGRKSHRRFSLQPFHHKHKQHDQEVTEISKTPEESTASIDGNTSCMPDGPTQTRTSNNNHNNNNNNNNDRVHEEYGNSSTSNKSYSHKHNP